MTYFFDSDNLLLCTLVTVGLQLFFFCIATFFTFDKVTDIALGLNFILLAWLTFILTGSGFPKQILITACQSLWALRLGGFLFYRILKMGKDSRFDGIRENKLLFLGFWIAQAFLAILVSFPVIFVNSENAHEELEGSNFPEITDIFGGLIWALGFTTEAIADWQKFTFKSKRENQAKWCQEGLWSFSRHPNYFGDITLLTGIFIIGIPVYKTYQWISIISPIFTMIILLFFSGLPPLERSLNKRFGRNPEFIEYKKSVSPLIPFPPNIYKITPDLIKKVFFFEYPMYNEDLDLSSNLPSTSEKPKYD